ncbi:hypothetical protein EI74_0203 [Mycoplasma testudineum]|uniref:DUF2130 domain-containing protein n=1 Tax=Mycoplasma testudineum TaxID=244584 RepID=A0A4R6IG93_9MOLU|nr:DUF2130 domain-containing protein [Mycoplasma testudineum]OYD27074.1 hypothetical protein CG473_00265 [Mycoplasma testudineum]TDO21172.1 hypothetical protein EI74_0203 [Mycoplasma testudineum]
MYKFIKIDDLLYLEFDQDIKKGTRILWDDLLQKVPSYGKRKMLNETFKSNAVYKDDYKDLEQFFLSSPVYENLENENKLKIANIKIQKDSEIMELQKLHEQESKRLAETITDLNAIKSKLDLEIVALKGRLNNFETEKQKEILELEHKMDNAINYDKQQSEKIINELNEKIINLKNDNQNLINNKEQEITIAKSKAEIDANKKIDEIRIEKEEKIQKMELSFTQKISELETTNSHLEMNLKRKDEDLANLKREKQSINIKLLGEELEEDIFQKVTNKYGLLAEGKIKFEKTTAPIKGTKPDFLFEIMDGKKTVMKIVIEAKTFQKFDNDGNPMFGSTKNRDHYSKLEKDRNNFKADYAILATELEPQNNFLISKPTEKEYRNIFVVRPQYLDSLLDMFVNIADKLRIINNKIINFEEKENIIEKFNNMKDSILNITIKNIDNQANKIETANEMIKKQSDIIAASIRTMIDSHINTLKNKMENFNIIKMAEKISKLEMEE